MTKHTILLMMIILAVVLLPCSCISVRQAFIPSLSFYPFKSRKDRTQFLMHLKSSNLGLLKGPHIFGEAMTWWLDEILLRKLLSLEKSHHSLMTFHHHHHHHHFQNIVQTASNGKVASITFVFPAVLFVSCTEQ